MYAYAYIAEFAVRGERRRIGDTSWRARKDYTRRHRSATGWFADDWLGVRGAVG